MIRIKNRCIFNIGMFIIYGLGNVAKLHVDNYEWIKDTSQFN